MLRLASPVALAVLLLAGVPAAGQQACAIHAPADGTGLGEPLLIDFGPDDTITTVFLLVKEGLLRPFVVGTFALDMTITSVDGINHFHGTDVVSLSSTAVFDDSTQVWDVVVPWTDEDEAMVVNDLYPVCAQPVLGPTPIGPESCADFGPF